MSSLLKLFGDRGTRKRTKKGAGNVVPARSRSISQDGILDHDPISEFHEVFSDDPAGQHLKGLWKTYCDLKIDTAVSPVDRMAALHQVVRTILESNDSIEADYHALYSNSAQPQFLTAAPSADGLPASIVLEIVHQLFVELKDHDKEKGLHDSDSDDEYNIPPGVTINTLYLESCGHSDPEALEQHRQRVLDMIRCIGYIVRSAASCTVLRHTLEMGFARLMVSLGRQFMQRLPLVSGQDGAGAAAASVDTDFLFSLRATMLFIQVILQSLALPPLEFLDLLPQQPLSKVALDHLLDPNHEWNTIFNHDRHPHRAAASSGSKQKKQKADLVHDLAIAGSMKVLMETVHNITEIRMSAAFSAAWMSDQSKTMLAVVDVEALYGIVGLATSFPDFVPLDLTLFKPVERTFDMKSNTTIQHPALFVRKQLLCLRINGWLLARLRTIKVEAPHYSIRLFSATIIANFLNWMSSRFDEERQPGDWVEELAQSEECFVMLSMNLKLGDVTRGHDLWPWRDPSQRYSTRPLQQQMQQQDFADFHILSKPLATRIQNSLKNLPSFTIWDSVISEILGSYMLSNRHHMVTAKINKDNLHYVYEVFDSLFRSKQTVQVEYGSEHDLLMPITQIKFIEFISQLFKAADASNIFSIISEFETFRFLLGEKFLLAHCSLATNLNEIFQSVTVRREVEGSIEVRMSQITDPRYSSLYIWFYMHNCILDYFHGLVIYSLYFQTDHNKVQAYLSFEDILLVLAQYMVSLSKGNRFPGCILYQLSCLVLNLSDIVLSMDFQSSASYLMRFVRNLLEIIDHQFQGKLAGPVDRLGFEFVGSYAVVQLFLQLIQPTQTGDFSSKDVFLTADNYVSLDLVQEIGNLVRQRAIGGVNQSPSITPRKETRFRSDSSPKLPGEAPNEKVLRVRSSFATVVMMLLSEHFQCAGLVVVQNVIISCAMSIEAAEKSTMTSEERLKTKQTLRALAGEVIGAMIQVFAVSYKHPDRSFSVDSAKNCLNALTVILRDETISNLRIHIQEFVRRDNLIYELLRGLAKCLNGHEMIRMRTYSDDLTAEPLPSLIKPILCSGLATLTAIVSGNEACKNALRVLLNSSREKIGSTKARHATTVVERKDRTSTAPTKSASGLVSLILCAEKVPGPDVIAIMFDMLLDGPSGGREFLSQGANAELQVLFGNDEDKPTIRNTSVMQDFFQLIPHCSHQVQRFGLESFRNLISGCGSLVNLTVCATTRPKVFDIVLDLFPYLPDSIQSCSAELLDLLGRYVVSVSSLKHLFRMLQKPDGNSPAYSWKIIQALQGMFLEDLGPKHSFVLDGISSGLRLPAIYRWPKLKGLSFTCWLRVETPRLDFDWMAYCPQVFSLRDERGLGLQLFLRQVRENEPLKIVFKYTQEQGEPMVCSPSSPALELSAGQWYFLAVTISVGSFYSKGEMKVQLNGKTHKEDIGPWKLPEPIVDPLIGDCPSTARSENEYQTLRGQMGAIYFFSEALSETQLQNIYSLGADYIYNFEPYSAGYKDLSGSSSGGGSKRKSEKKTILDDGTVTSKILLAFNPVVLRGRYFLDNTPEKNELLWRLPNGVEVPDDLRSDIPRHCKMHAMRMPGTFRSTTQDVRLALNSLGGIKAIIPLFAQLVQSTAKLSTSSDDAAESPATEQSLNSNFFPAVLGLFMTLIEDNEDNKRIFLRCGGFSVIRDFLEKAPGSCFNLITLNQFVAILENLKSDQVAKESCFDMVLCNFRLWSRASIEVQICWMDWLINALGALELSNPSVYSAQRFIDTLYLHYDYTPAPLPLPLNLSTRDNSSPRADDTSPLSVEWENNAVSDDTLLSNQQSSDTTNLIRCSMTNEQIKTIRGKVYHLIKISIARGNGSPHEEAIALIKYAVACSSVRGKLETIRFLDALLMNLEDQDKLHGLLLGLCMTDSLLALESLLDIKDVKFFQAVVALVSTLTFRVAIHNVDFSVLSQRLRAENAAASNAPLNKMASVADEMAQASMMDGRLTTMKAAAAEALHSLSVSMEFSEVGNLQSAIIRFCDTVAAKLFALDGHGSLVSWTFTMFFHILTGLRWEKKAESAGGFQEVPLPASTSKVAFPLVFFTVVRLLSSSHEVVVQLRPKLVGQLLRLVTSDRVNKQVVSSPRWEVSMMELLEVQVDTFFATRSTENANTLVGILQLIVRLTEAILCAELPMESASSSMRTMSWDSIPRFNLSADSSHFISVRDIFSILRKGRIGKQPNSAESFAVRSTLLVILLWRQLKQSTDMSSKTNVWRASCVGLTLLDYLKECKQGTAWSCTSDEDGRDCQEELWSMVIEPLLTTTSLVEVHHHFKMPLKALFRREPSESSIASLSWCMVRMFFNSFKCHRWHGCFAAVDGLFASQFDLPSAAAAAAGCTSTQPHNELNAADERKLFRSGLLPLVGIRLLYSLHQYTLSKRPAESKGASVWIPLYVQVLKGLEPYNYELFAFERLYFVAMVPLLGLDVEKDSSAAKLISASAMEITDFFNITLHESVASKPPEGESFVDRHRLGEDQRVDIIVAILGHNVMPSTFRAHFFLAQNSPEEAAGQWASGLSSNAISWIARLKEHGVRLPADSNVSEEELWKSVSSFLHLCGHIVVEDVVTHHLSDGRERVVSTMVHTTSVAPKLASKSSSHSQSLFLPSPRSAEDMPSFIVYCECRRMKEWTRLQLESNRRSEMKRSRLFAQLANERGPWGYSADHRREIFWTLDGNETNGHLRLRLKRNLMGTHHSVASFKSSGKLMSSSEDNADGINGPLGWIEMDLKKYKASSPGKASKSSKLPQITGSDDKVDKGEDDEVSEGEEEGADETHIGDGFLSDSELLSIPVEIISCATNSSGGKTVGKLEVTRSRLSFQRSEEFVDYDFENKTGNNEFMWACQCFASTTWSGADIAGVYRRYYQLRYVALEVFLTNRTSIFFNLFETATAKRVYTFMTKRMRAPNMSMIFTGRPKNAINRIFTANGMTVTQAWVARKITNFDYLMYLNFIAGRTFNDLAQYPVFPWVLADYTSQRLDLREHSIYRKFDRPIGAQLDAQRELLIEKYQSSLSMQDEGFYPYHCGSHYSTSAMVLWYLIRMEPFTSFHVWLQDGKFDRPDRLFHCIASTWSGCTTNTQDVKELIPEFFSNPEFLSNINHVSFGTRQDGEVLDEVILPKWCNNPTDFIRIQRDALESEYVSSQLHNWIDLIFGCKQRPPFLQGSEKTVQACNIFFHLSYIDAVNLDEMRSNDPDLYNRTIRQIDSYGQTPVQLFKKEHPRRKSILEVQDILWPIASIVPGADTAGSYVDDPAGHEASGLEKPKRVLCYGECKVSNFPVLFLVTDCVSSERLITIDSHRVLGCHQFQMRNPSHVPPFSIKLDKMALSQSTGQVQRSGSIASYLPYGTNNREKVVGIPFASPVVLNASWIENLGVQSTVVPLDLLGKRENKINYLEEELKARGRAMEVGGNAIMSSRFTRSASKRVGGATPVSPAPSSNTWTTASTTSAAAGMIPSSPMDSIPQLTPSPSMRDLAALAASARAAGEDQDRSGRLDISGLDRALDGEGGDRLSRLPLTSPITPGSASTQVTPSNKSSTGGRRAGTANASAPSGGGSSSNNSSTSQSGPTGGHRLKNDRSDFHLNSHLFCYLPALKLIFSAGHWDNAFKVTSADTGKLVQSISHHREVTTCIACGSDYGKHWLVVGSKDCTITVWEIYPERENEPVHAPPSHTLYGHDDSVNCVVVQTELDLIVSGSDDGTIMIHTLRDGIYVRSIVMGSLAELIGGGGSSSSSSSSSATGGHLSTPRHAMTTSNAGNSLHSASSSAITTAPSSQSSPSTTPFSRKTVRAATVSDIKLTMQSSTSTSSSSSTSASQHTFFSSTMERSSCRVHLLAISKEGVLVAYSNDGHLLASYTMNGRLLKMIQARERIHALCLAEDGRTVLTGGERGLVVIRWIHNLAIASSGPRRGLESVIDGSNEPDFEAFPCAIRSMTLSAGERHLLVGLDSGDIRILAQDSEYLRRKLHRQLIEIGMLSM